MRIEFHSADYSRDVLPFYLLDVYTRRHIRAEEMLTFFYFLARIRKPFDNSNLFAPTPLEQPFRYSPLAFSFSNIRLSRRLN